ncbi:MAG: hypothetical protein ACREJ3_18105, partial [Polyangiaceae bacterium]
MKLLVLGEGKNDIGDPYADPACRGAVTIFAQRVLQAHGVGLADGEVHGGQLSRFHNASAGARGFDRKVTLSIAEAARRGYASVAIVVDRDGAKNAQRLSLLEKGREEAKTVGRSPGTRALAARTAVGVAIETIEAWLLADGAAAKEILHPKSQVPSVNPESLWGEKTAPSHPKNVFQRLLESATRTVSHP